MSKGMKSAVIAAFLAAMAAQTRTAIAAEVVIDAFSAATAKPGTLLNVTNPDENVLNNVAMTTVTAYDTVAGVIGGTRQLNVSIATCAACPVDDAIVGVVPGSAVLDYATSPQVDGSFTLIYDANGAGLSASLVFAQGIRLRLANIDASSYPLDVTITLIEGANTATSSTSMMTGPGTLDLDFPFVGFTNIANVDLTNLTRIEVLVNPTDVDAGDLQLGPITTYGTPPFEPAIDCQDGIDNDNNGLIDCKDPACIASSERCQIAPAMSTGMTALLIAVLSVCGLLGITRLQPRRTSSH